jgi:hypothetical protein
VRGIIAIMKRTQAVLVVAVAWTLAGCEDRVVGRVCTTIAVPALAVTVMDGATGRSVCDATVVAVEGSFRSTLERFGTGETCAYSGPYERAGVYEVQVTMDGYRPVSEGNLRVTSDECHVVTRRLTVTLAR